MSNTQTLRDHILKKLMERVMANEEGRAEALKEFFNVSLPNVPDNQSQNLAGLVPPLMPKLYEKWIGMFTDRLFETVPLEQIEELCKGDRENDAALLLVYIMYLESATMEKQIVEDLSEYGIEQTGSEDGGDLAVTYIRARMTQLTQELKRDQPEQ